MRTYLTDTTKLFCSIVLTFLIFIIPAKSQTLTEMVDQLLDSHEDIINAQKELEEAGIPASSNSFCALIMSS